MKRILATLALLAGTALTGIALVATPATAFSVNDLPTYICHAGNAETNPYQTNSPANQGALSGHLADDGPIWYPGAKADGVVWGDIIPPVEDFPGLEDGLNWDNGGEAVWENGCAVPEGDATLPTVTAPDCGVDGTLVIPDDNDALEYVVTPEYDGPGTYSIDVNVIGPFILLNADDFPVELEVLPALTEEDPECAAPAEIVVPEEPTVTAATCDAAGALVLPDGPEGVTYNVVENEDGTVTVTAEAEPGFELDAAADSEWTLEIPAALDGEDCAEPQETPDPPVLPNTGAPSSGILAAGLALAAAGAMTLVGGRRPVGRHIA